MIHTSEYAYTSNFLIHGTNWAFILFILLGISFPTSPQVFPQVWQEKENNGGGSYRGNKRREKENTDNRNDGEKKKVRKT